MLVYLVLCVFLCSPFSVIPCGRIYTLLFILFIFLYLSFITCMASYDHRVLGLIVIQGYEAYVVVA
jgi:hypothetical protein